MFENEELASWLEECVKKLFEQNKESKIESIAIVTISENGYVMTGYFNADSQDKAIFAHNIQADAMLDIVCNNAGLIRDAINNMEDDDDDGNEQVDFG